jgi:undecaprenyl-diphosphatase
MDFLINWDHQLFHLVNSTLSHPWLDIFFPAVTDLHKTFAFKILAPVIVLSLFWRRYGKQSFTIFFGCLFCLAIADSFGSQVLKKNVERHRPFEVAELGAIQRSPAGSFSMPSNHAINMFALATYVSAFVPPALPFMSFVAIGIAYSRVYNGVHFPADVFVGALIGVFFRFCFSKAMKSLLQHWKARRMP